MCRLFRLASGDVPVSSSQEGKKNLSLGSWEVGSSIRLTGRGAVGLRLLLVGPIVGPWLFLNDSSERV